VIQKIKCNCHKLKKTKEWRLVFGKASAKEAIKIVKREWFPNFGNFPNLWKFQYAMNLL